MISICFWGCRTPRAVAGRPEPRRRRQVDGSLAQATRGVNLREPASELGPLRGESLEGVTIGKTLHGGGEGVGGSGVGGAEKEYKKADGSGKSTVADKH